MHVISSFTLILLHPSNPDSHQSHSSVSPSPSSVTRVYSGIQLELVQSLYLCLLWIVGLLSDLHHEFQSFSIPLSRLAIVPQSQQVLSLGHSCLG